MNFTKIFFVLALTLLITKNAGSIFSKLKQLKDNLHKMYKSKFGKEKTWQFLGLNPNEYPGTNGKYRNYNQQMWDEYYKCLSAQNDNLGEYKTVSPEAVQGFEGASVKLECKVCISPEERLKSDAIEWEWAPEDKTHMELVEYNEHILLSPEDKILHIYNLRIEQTGQYMCKLGDTLTAPYFLTVVNSTVNMSEVHTKNAPHGPYPSQLIKIPYHDLILDTEWGTWSPCSKCNKIGRKHRLGYCIVIYQQNSQKKIEIFKNNTETEQETIETSKNDLKITEKEIELIKIFQYGIPCKSHILPESIKNLPEIKTRLDEIMIGYCRESCPEERIFEVKDKNGNVIEIANNSAGIFSMLQGPPQIEPTVERRLQYEKKGYAVTLTCPGNLNSDAPIQWQIGGKNIVPQLLAKESNGRVYISATDRINIRKVKLSDSNLYSCWQHRELAGTIRLVVEKNMQFNFNHHIMLVGMIVILATFIHVYLRAFLGRKYAKIRN